MTSKEWLEQARSSKEILTDFVASYHPAMFSGNKKADITAPNAESACMMIREEIRQETEESPVGAFKDALESGDIDTINSLLNAAWFGVPESTSCWQIPGFKEAVELMEDLPDEMYGEEGLSEEETQNG